MKTDQPTHKPSKFKKALLKTTCLATAGLYGTYLLDSKFEPGGREWRTVEFSDSRAMDNTHFYNAPDKPVVIHYRFPRTEKLDEYQGIFFVRRPMSKSAQYLVRRAMSKIEAHGNVQFVEETDPQKRGVIEIRSLLEPVLGPMGEVIATGYHDHVSKRDIAIYERGRWLNCPEAAEMDKENVFYRACAIGHAQTESTALHELMHALGASDVSILTPIPNTFPLNFYKTIAPEMDNRDETVMSYTWKDYITNDAPDKPPSAKLGRLDKQWLDRFYPKTKEQHVKLPSPSDEIKRQIFPRVRNHLGFGR